MGPVWLEVLEIFLSSCEGFSLPVYKCDTLKLVNKPEIKQDKNYSCAVRESFCTSSMQKSHELIHKLQASIQMVQAISQLLRAEQLSRVLWHWVMHALQSFMHWLIT